MSLVDPSTKTYLDHDRTTLPPTKIGRLELDEESNNACTLETNLAGYANKYIQNYMSNQSLTHSTLNKSPIPNNTKWKTFSTIICASLG